MGVGYGGWEMGDGISEKGDRGGLVVAVGCLCCGL
jgi:hypothetical protein